MIRADELVRLAIARVAPELKGEQTGDARLAEILGLGQGGAANVKRWRRGPDQPMYETTMALLELIGALNEDALRPRTPEEEARLRRAEELAARVKDARGVGEGTGS